MVWATQISPTAMQEKHDKSQEIKLIYCRPEEKTESRTCYYSCFDNFTGIFCLANHSLHILIVKYINSYSSQSSLNRQKKIKLIKMSVHGAQKSKQSFLRKETVVLTVHSKLSAASQLELLFRLCQNTSVKGCK